MIVIGGCGSSGTTLLRHMLDRHSAICCGPESTVFLKRVTAPAELGARFAFDAAEIAAWRDGSRSQAEFAGRFRDACLARTGKTVWADKTPENVRRFAFVRRHFPRAYLVHVIRDGRDVACSLRQQRWMKLRNLGPRRALARCAAYWSERVEAGRAMKGDPRYIEVRYEDLISRPEATLRRLLAFCGLAWEDGLLTADAASAERATGPIFGTSVGRWRNELTAEEVGIVEHVGGAELAMLGYERANGGTRSVTGPPLGRLPELGLWQRLWIELRTVGQALADRRISPATRMLALLGFAYNLGPIDLIPNRIPVIGHLDEVMSFPLSVALFLWLAPRAIIREHRSVVTALEARRDEGLRGYPAE